MLELSGGGSGLEEGLELGVEADGSGRRESPVTSSGLGSCWESPVVDPLLMDSSLGFLDLLDFLSLFADVDADPFKGLEDRGSQWLEGAMEQQERGDVR